MTAASAGDPFPTATTKIGASYFAASFFAFASEVKYCAEDGSFFFSFGASASCDSAGAHASAAAIMVNTIFFMSVPFPRDDAP